MNSVKNFWWLVEEAKKTGIFYHNQNELFIRQDLKENGRDKIMWTPNFWKALFGEELIDTECVIESGLQEKSEPAWKFYAHRALDVRLDGGDVTEFIYNQYMEVKNAKAQNQGESTYSNGDSSERRDDGDDTTNS